MLSRRLVQQISPSGYQNPEGSQFPISRRELFRQHSSISSRNSDVSMANSTYLEVMRHHFRHAGNGVDRDPATPGVNFEWEIRSILPVIFIAVAFGTVGLASWAAARDRSFGLVDKPKLLKQSTQVESSSILRVIEERINNHPMVAELRQRPELTESRPHMAHQGQSRAATFTINALSGPRKIPIPAYTWVERGGKSLVSILFVGEDLCSYPGIAHGGFLATMLDEGLAKCCFCTLPFHVGVTANLTIDYRRPTPTGAYLVVRAETTKVEGRKAWVKGRIESLPGQGNQPEIYAEAAALFVSPKFAAVSEATTLDHKLSDSVSTWLIWSPNEKGAAYLHLSLLHEFVMAVIQDYASHLVLFDSVAQSGSLKRLTAF